MFKTVFTIILPEPKVRKKQAPPAKAHKNKNAYTRKRKHRNGAHDSEGWSPERLSPRDNGGLVFQGSGIALFTAFRRKSFFQE